MNKPSVLFFVAMLNLFEHTNAYTQTNLVNNSSFEDTVRCPPSLGGMLFPSVCKFWYDPDSASSDYFNSCASIASQANVPDARFGWQYARTGVAYAGFATNNYTLVTDYREYIQSKLDSVLIVNHNYCVEFYISLGNNLNIATNNIGMYISNTIPLPPPVQLPYANCIPQINATIPITDTAGWTMISGTYTAHGGEQYITIGNFYTDAQTDTVRVANQPGGDGSYYYIDDVSLVDCTQGLGMQVLSKQSLCTLYPNPNDGNMTLEYNLQGSDNALFSIYAIDGRLVKQLSLSPNTSVTISATELNAGIYYYMVKEGNTNVKTDKLIIIK